MSLETTKKTHCPHLPAGVYCDRPSSIFDLIVMHSVVVRPGHSWSHPRFLSEAVRSAGSSPASGTSPVPSLVARTIGPNPNGPVGEVERMHDPTGDDTEGPSAAPGSGGRIGPYRLLEKLGEGGMGEVWLAEQTEPVRRQVALKVIKPGMDTKQVVARFEAERQALALMDHPAIAQGASTPARRPRAGPYFVMEYVRGVPITEHCDRHRLTDARAPELFVQVCDGVQHAHQKAIIHRDLKPSNVLVSIQDGKRGAEDHRLRRGQGDGAAADRADAAHRAGRADRHAGVHEPGAGGADGPGRRHADRRLLAGRDALRAAGRERCRSTRRSCARRASTGSGARSARRSRRGRRRAFRRSGRATRRSRRKRRRTDLGSLRRQLTGRPRLDHDEGAREGPHAALRLAGGAGGGHPAPPRERAGAGRPAVGGATGRGSSCGGTAWGVGAAAAGVLVLVAFAATMAVQAQRIARERDRRDRHRRTSSRW